MKTTKKTKTNDAMTKREATVLAAIFARSNMGHGTPDDATISRLLVGREVTISSAVMATCGDLMETDEHQAMFEEEARWWFKKDFAGKPLATALKPWPDYLARLVPLFAAAVDADTVNPAGKPTNSRAERFA